MTAPCDLTSVQQAVWLDQLLAPDVPTYNLGLAWRIDGELDEAVLAAAIEDVTQSHDALRLVFGVDGDAPVQRVTACGARILPTIDLSGDPDAEAKAWAHIQAEARRPYTLYGEPLWSVQLVRVAPAGWYWLTRFHHLISDGASIGIFSRAVGEAYDRRLRGEPGRADAPSYLELIEKDRAYLASAKHADDGAFWRERFAQPPPALCAARGGGDGGRELWTIERAELERLRAYFTGHGCTIQHAMLAMLAVYFARTHGVDEVVIGVPVHNRGAARDRRTLGMFSSMIPLAIQVDGARTFAELMQRIAAELKRSYRYQKFPIHELHRALRLERSLFDVTLAQEVYPAQATFGGARWAPFYKMYSGASQQPLAVCVAEYPENDHGLVELNFSRGAFADDEIARMQRRLARLLAAAIAGGDVPVASLPVLDDEEATAIAGWNATARDYEQGLCLHELFEAQVARTPDAIAVVDGARELTYAALNRRANQLARVLRGYGVGPDVAVGICMERSAEMVIAIYAALKAGGCYLPLDPDYPVERVRRMVDNGAPAVVLCDAVGEPVMRDVDRDLPRLAMTVDAWADEAADDLIVEGTNRRLAYVIYTSGSTGTPKGVMNEHRGAVNRMQWMQEAYGLGGDDVVLQKTPTSFDVSVWELFWPLMTGARLVMARPHGHKDPAYLADVIRAHRVTTLHFVPSMLQAFVGCAASLACPSLRRVVCSGEALPAPLVRAFHARWPGVALHNLYGPTEAAVDVTAWTCAPGHDVIPIGRPIANTQIYILDERLAPVGIGVAGEIFIGGIQVARGYLHQPALTAERFVETGYGRVYKTGDVGRWRADGAIEYLGRNDHQVKIRGVRIELGEIEARLAEVAGEVVVMAREDEPGDKRLVAYFTGDVSPEDLRAHATQSLPVTMVPAAYVRLAAMPVTSNGKLDRKALPAPDAAALAHRAYEAPVGDVEAALAAIWADLLHVERVGRHDSFFALGGHSLLAVRLIERLRGLGLHADVRAVFHAATLAALAAAVRPATDDVTVPASRIPDGASRITPDLLPLVALSQASIDAIVGAVDGGAPAVQDIYPLAPLQEGILFHHLVRRPDDADPYVMSGVLAFADRARLDRFVAALQQVVDRHDILRTSVAWHGLEQPVQVVHRRAELPVEEVAYTGDVAAQLAADASGDRIDVTRAPLLRGRIAADPARGRHLLRLAFHHLVLDHATLETVLEEARALEDGRTDLPAPVQFRAFVAQARRGVTADEHAAFFRAQLGDIDAPTAPFDLLDVQGDGRAIEEVTRAAAPALARSLRERARALGVSAASLVHLAWALVLARTTGRRDVVFGTVLLGRMAGGDAARALGVFINTLPVRIAIDDRAIADVARASHAALVDLLRHEHAPLAIAQRASAVPAGAPLFTSLVNYRFSGQQGDGDALGHILGDGIALVSSHERTSYPLGLTVDDLGASLAITIKAAATIGAARMCDFVERALAAVVSALADEPGRAACSLDVLPDAERARVQAWNATACDVPRGCLASRFEAQVARTPDATAVVDGATEVSFAALDQRADRLAGYLRGLGVGPDRRVAICLPRCAEMIVAVLGVLKAGGAYVPLDPAAPSDRLAHVLGDAAPVCTIAMTATQARLPVDASVVLLDRDAAAIAACPAVRGAALPDDRLAYVIYTSGSTGRPKGVMVEHRSVVNLWAALERAVHAAHATARVSLNAPLAFDSSVKQWVQLLSGRALVVVPDEVRADGAALRRFVAAQRIDVLDCTPSQLAVMQEIGELACAVALVGGEAIGAAQWRALAASPATAFYNVYGPTECTVDATAIRVTGEAPTIGGPLGNVRAYIVDDALRPAPIGATGEIVIGGAGVARGYLNDPARTAERFVDGPDGRVYKTGDLGRWRADGSIEYLGRNDFQVKLRGYRIELGEIEATLVQLAGVGEVVVIARDERLVAYVTGDAAIDAMRAHVAAALPAYMAPAAYVRLAAMPLTRNGKLDRQALPAPDAIDPERFEAPRGELEEIVAGAWAELLGVDRVSRHDDFFALGGHSLLAVRLASRVRRVLGVELAVSALFAHPVLADLAAHLAGASRDRLPAIPVAERRGAQPVSLAQQRLWFLSRLEAGSAAYHIRGAVRLDGALDRGALIAALQALVARHPALRTTFEIRDGEPMQVVHAAASLALDERDVRSADESAARRLRDAHGARGFDLARDLPLRVQLVRIADEAYVLQLVIHHIAADGWSLGILLDELSRLYQGEALAPLTVSYADYAVWQRALATRGQLADQAAYWQRTLAGAPVELTLPWDRPRPAKQDHAGAIVPVALDAALVAALRALGRRHGATMYMTLLASWAATLARRAGQREVVIGSPVAGRSRPELEPIVGCFVNTLAHRIDLAGDPTVGDLLARTRAQVLAAQEHQDLPFDQVVEAVKPARSLAHTPLFQVMLDWEQVAERTLALPGLVVTRLARELDTAQFDLTLSLRESADGGIHGLISFATALFDRATVERFAGAWRRVVAQMACGEGRAVADLALLDEAERAQVVTGWNATDRAYPQGLCLHELFEAQVVRTPAAIAVVDGTRQVTYRELNTRANQLARALRGAGVGPDVVVGICMERSAEMMIAIYAALKAGGCYLPLDPDYPVERVRRMIDHGAPAVVLCDAPGLAVMTAIDGECRVPRLRLSADAWPWANEIADNVVVEGTNRRLAYVIYTSGSTGTPKGVMNEHRGAVNRMQWMQEAYGLDGTDVVLQKTPTSFDVSVWELFWPLMTGARLVMARPHGHKDPAYLADVIRAHRVTTLHFVPSMLQAFVASEASLSCPSLRRVVCSGEALPAPLVRAFHARWPGVALHNLYGPTEAAVDVTAWTCEPGHDVIPIGRPIANTQIYILDERLAPVGIGVAGEIFIGGIQVARGYLHQPALTAERFVETGYGRVYKTGDVGRWRADGAIEYLGRNDHQVKIRGVRIELGEIEARLAEVGGEVVVMAREDEPGDKRLVAYFTGDVSPEDLRAHATQSLPATMVPAAYVRLAAMPVTSNGKLDRKALPAPDAAALAQRAYEAPVGEVEAALAAIWADLLHVERVGRHDSFFALGGHSLLAVRLIERMRRRDFHIDVATVFTAATLCDLAAAIRTASDDVIVPPNLIDCDLSDADEPAWASDVEELRL